MSEVKNIDEWLKTNNAFQFKIIALNNRLSIYRAQRLKDGVVFDLNEHIKCYGSNMSIWLFSHNLYEVTLLNNNLEIIVVNINDIEKSWK